MIELAWSQISGAAAGGVAGGFSGFVANLLQQRQESARARRSVACALHGEIGALAQFIEENTRARIQLAERYHSENGTYLYRHVRGERDYMPVFRGLGGGIGLLPSPLPRDLVTWYTRLAACLERTRELHEVALDRGPELFGYAAEIVDLQQSELIELVRGATPLLVRLRKVMRRGHE
jgi:hypothetical protein